MEKRPIKTLAIGIIFAMAIFALTTASHAAEVTLAWDPQDNPHSNLTGYNLYYKAGSSVQADPDVATLTYIALTDEGFDPDNPMYTVTDLLDNTEYSFAVTAMVEDDESGMSNEVGYNNNSGSGAGSGGGGCFISLLK